MGTTPGGQRGPRGRGLWLGTLLAAAFAADATASIQLSPGEDGARVIELSATQQGHAGAALRAALVARDAGDFSAADDRLQALSLRYPVIADYADLLRLRLRAEVGDWQGAVALAAAWWHTDSPLEAERDEIVGAAHAALGNSRAARAAWAHAAAASRDVARLAALHLKLAASFEAEGDLDAAVKSYLEVWTAHPLASESERAAAALDAIARERGADPRTAMQYRKRGDALFLRRRNEAALAAYEHALALATLGAAETRRVRSQRALTLFRLRRYSEAAEAFRALPATVENRIEGARATARAGDPEGAARELEAIGRVSRGRAAAQALYLAGLLWDGEDEPKQAQVLFGEVTRSAAGASYAKAALWRLGWAAFREGRFAAAVAAFEQLLEREADPIEALRTRYWLARASERAGDSQAVPAFAAIAREFPFSYYGWRARWRAGAASGREAVAAIPPGKSAFGEAEISRPQILLEAGLEEEARRELDLLQPRARGLGDRLALSNLYADSGDFHQSQSLIVSVYDESLARGPVPRQLDLWWAAWPAPFADGVRSATSNGSLIEPALVYALMREESGYRPEVVSISGARGLLQIMPETGERLARDVALADFTADDLFLPDVNLRLGTYYLRALLERFGGRKSAAIASYNAGPEAVARWLDPALEDDEWVESIPYEQTRAYVKRVLRSLYAYQVLY